MKQNLITKSRNKIVTYIEARNYFMIFLYYYIPLLVINELIDILPTIFSNQWQGYFPFSRILINLALSAVLAFLFLGITIVKYQKNSINISKNKN